MESPDGARSESVALSAAEEAYLRRFVRRHALSGLAGRALALAAIAALGLALRPMWVEPPAAPTAAAAGVAALDAEIEALRGELGAQGAAAPLDAATASAVAELARRIEAIAREIMALRARVEAPQTPARTPAPAPLPAGTEVAQAAERLRSVERRLGQAEASRAKIEAELLARLHGLELRQEEREREDASALRAALDRVGRLEASRGEAEARRLEAQQAMLRRLDSLESRAESVPASPQP